MLETKQMEAYGTEAVLVALPRQRVVHVTGSDAMSFLQGQLTCDLRELDGGHHRLGTWCTAKGRALVLMRLWQRADGIAFHLPEALAEPILKRLRMYVLRAQVVLEPSDDGLLQVAGPRAEAHLAAVLDTVLPDAPDGCLQHNGITLMRLPDAVPRFELIAAPDVLTALKAKLVEAGCCEAPEALATLLDIRAGLPSIDPANSERFVPQMLNLDRLAGIGFTKGCYTGQEVVARMQYLGKLKRRMYRAGLDGTAPVAGSELSSSGSTSLQGAGHVVTAVDLPEGGCELLVVIDDSAVAHGEIGIEGGASPLRLLELPYPLAEEGGATS